MNSHREVAPLDPKLAWARVHPGGTLLLINLLRSIHVGLCVGDRSQSTDMEVSFFKYKKP